MSGLGPEKVPLGSNGIASNGIGGVAPFSGSFASTNGNTNGNVNGVVNGNGSSMASPNACLLYTSDAADE